MPVHVFHNTFFAHLNEAVSGNIVFARVLDHNFKLQEQ